jgi:predicted O-linked N-acetylglucosamine transferase (SPINDLY family)
MTAMDYFIGDQHIPKPGTEHLFSEKIYRLPRVHSSFRPAGDANIIRPPYFANGYITFGCFNNQRKINQDVVKVWCVIMHLTPGSRMILKCQGLASALNQQPLKEWFSEGGIALDRIHFEDRSANREYLEALNRIDIALDPFPYNGGTTSQDALWMGVPLVSLEGRLAVGCAGKNILSTVGLPVATSPEHYVTLACALAQAMPTTPDIRVKVHTAMKNSALLDEPGLMRALEEAYRTMWTTWCATQ